MHKNICQNFNKIYKILLHIFYCNIIFKNSYFERVDDTGEREVRCVEYIFSLKHGYNLFT